MKKGLLLGAGFSYDLGMPLSSELTAAFLSIFNKENVRRSAKALSAQQPYTKDRPINENAIAAGLNLIIKYNLNSGNNYEKLLSDLQALSGISSPTQSDRDSYNFLFVICYDIIHKILCLYQKASYEIIYSRNRECFRKFENLLSDKETWVFTLNHDLYLEYLSLDFRIPITYGEDGKIIFPISNLDLNKRIEFSFTEREKMHVDSVGFFKDVNGINLIKLHGGLSEREYKDRSILCNLNLNKSSSQELAAEFELLNEMAYYHHGKKVGGGKDETITNIDGELDIISKSMLTGGRKYSDTSKAKVGEEKLKLFDDVLRCVDELTIIGYGFGDEHINFRISNALLLNEKLRVVIVNPTIRRTPDCIKQFDYDSRIKRASCGAAHWMDYCKNGKWNEEQMKALKDNERYRNDVREQVQNQLIKFSGS